MKKHNILLRFRAFAFCAILAIVAGSCADLQVENLNNPDTRRVLATADDLKSVMGGAFVNLYTPFGRSAANTSTYYANTHMEWTGDYITMTNNFRAFWSQFKVEPRPQFNNTLGFPDRDLSGRPFAVWYAAISSANDVIRAVETEGKQIGPNGSENQMVLASAYFCKAMAYGYLANTFDRAYIMNPDTDPKAVKLVPYGEVMQEAQRLFDRTIDIASRNTFTFPANFINTTQPLNSDRLTRLCRTYAANFLVQNARNRAENTQVDWARVGTLTANGMREDYQINVDYANWHNSLQTIASLNWYWRTDHRIIRLMDPSYPKRFPAQASVASIPEAKSADARLKLYFTYETSLAFFRADRGPQLRSHYRFSRYDYFAEGTKPGPSPILFAYTNDLLRAESAAMRGQLSEAITILNAGKRVTVGKLEPLPASASRETVLETIFAERDIELTLTDYGIHFKDLRRRDGLQKGTILHFPVPVDELSVFGTTPYSYGGELSSDGKNTADGSNAWYVRP